MKVVVDHLYINGIPLLHLYKEGNERIKLPFVIFVHGFTSAKEHNLHYAYLLAKKGFRVALPEAKYHGERGFLSNENELMLKFWDIVIQMIQDLNEIKAYFEKKEWILNQQIGVAGTSMGGMITLGALTQYSWIKAAVCLMGSPYYQAFARQQIKMLKQEGVEISLSDEELNEQIDKLYDYDLSLHKEALANRPILFWHGKKDTVVPYDPTYQFYEDIKPLYQHNQDDLQFFSDENAGHKVSRQGVLWTVEWFEKHLQQNNRNEIKSSL
ncbi:esterase [Bacillus alveayuensis]|jgi:hypothetical protein|uniref:esterase n=1 Tax=Aeribacillus alveayuensis TaxID=279215 RepID=UPI0005D110A7|nr:esterase [Bacillus alveayuensis]